MEGGRYSEEQIIPMLNEREAGMKTSDFTPQAGISPAAFYNRTAKSGGMDVSDAKLSFAK